VPFFIVRIKKEAVGGLVGETAGDGDALSFRNGTGF
jgi:hypothetical protein